VTSPRALLVVTREAARRHDLVALHMVRGWMALGADSETARALALYGLQREMRDFAARREWPA
jgi:hypothetical protein